MYTKLSTAKLKTGEEMEIGVVLAPDLHHSDKVMPFLAHKGGEWQWHIAEALKGNISELETRFYIGQLDGNIICNIMTVEYSLTGILGHVFTLPDQRRKGACRLVMGQQINDFKRRGGGVLLLGTGYDSPPYWIYHSFGFRSVTEGSGFMRCATDERFEEKFFAPCSCQVVDVRWRDWPRANLFFSLRNAGVLRSVVFNLYGCGDFEWGFLSLKKGLSENSLKQCKLLESERGAIVGCAVLEPDKRWQGNTHLLDLFVHPNFADSASRLLGALDLSQRKVQSYVDDRSPEKVAALEAAGFTKEATLKRQIEWDGREMDVSIYAKYSS